MLPWMLNSRPDGYNGRIFAILALKPFTMKQLFSILMLTGIATSGFCQTKLISHKSHSGSMATFGMAVENNLFDIGESNFGEYPYRTIVTSQLDSVIFISEDKAVMITSEHCSSQHISIQDTIDNDKIFWQAGRDTVLNHQLFSQRHSLDSIKTVLKTKYNFRNEIDKVVFIGYDNDKKALRKENRKKKKKSVIPIITDDTGFPPKELMVMLLAALSGLVALTSYFYNKKTALRNA